MNIRQEFGEWLREQELNETPENLYNMNGLQSKEDFKNKVINDIFLTSKACSLYVEFLN